MQELEERIFNTGFADQMAEEGLSELKEREVWDANEMSEDELAKLMSTWNQVAAEQSRVMQDVWNQSSDKPVQDGGNVAHPQFYQRPAPQVIPQQNTVSSEFKEMEEEMKMEELFNEDAYDFADPHTEGDFVQVPAPQIERFKPSLESIFQEENKFASLDNPAQLIDNFLNDGDA